MLSFLTIVVVIESVSGVALAFPLLYSPPLWLESRQVLNVGVDRAHHSVLSSFKIRIQPVDEELPVA